jgi:peptide/nickel transport system permease protein
LVVVACIVTMAILSPWVTPTAEQGRLLDRLHPPLLFGGNWSHPLGTDDLGRDILLRLIGGAGVSLAVSVVGVGLAALVGTAAGVPAGYFGGWLDSLLMRLVDVTLSMPVILLAMLAAVRFGPSTANVAVVIALLLWARFARLARGEALTLRVRPFIEGARALGASHWRIMVRHLVPHLLGSLLVLATLMIGWAILTEASLSFLGAGVPAPAPAWGSMVASGQDLLATAWWVSTIPGAMIAVLIVASNVIGDWLRDRLDPGQL